MNTSFDTSNAFERLVVSVPTFQDITSNASGKSVEEDAIALGYDMTRVRHLLKIFFFNFIQPNYRKNHNVCNAIRKIIDSFNIRGVCDSALQWHSNVPHEIDVDKVLGTKVFATSVGLDSSHIPVTSVFYSGLIHHLLAIKPSFAKRRSRPLLNALSPSVKVCLDSLLDKYEEIVMRCDAFISQYPPLCLTAKYLHYRRKERTQIEKAISVLRHAKN